MRSPERNYRQEKIVQSTPVGGGIMKKRNSEGRRGDPWRACPCKKERIRTTFQKKAELIGS